MRGALSLGVCAMMLGLAGMAVERGINWDAPSGIEANNALKNRTVLPTVVDFDHSVTLEALLRPGDDRRRWSNNRAAAIEDSSCA